MTLEVFTNTVGDEALVWPTDSEEQAMLAVDVLDAIQTIVDVLVDERGLSYEVGFSSTVGAYTDHSRKRIAIGAKPMTEGGKTFGEVVNVMTGFAVHEIGHTSERERALGAMLRAEWPGKVTPHRLANILSDVRLEATVIERFRGLVHVFEPAMVWIATATCPTHELAYGKTKHDRLNFVGQAVRYEPYVTFASDPETQDQLRWWKEWGAVDASTTNEDMMQRVRDGLERIKAGAEYEPVEPPPDAITDGMGNPTPGNPDSDDDTEGEGDSDGDPDADDTEGEGEGNGEGTEGEDEESDSEGGDGEADDEEDGEEGGSATDAPDLDEDPGEGNSGTEGDEAEEPSGNDPEGEPGEGEEGTEGEFADHVTDGQLDEGETLDRTETDSPMGEGAGGSGQAIADAADIDEGLDKSKLDKTQDELTKGESDDNRERYENNRLQQGVEEERKTTRLDAGAFGKMKVKVEL